MSQQTQTNAVSHVSEKSYQQTLKILNQQTRPSSVLCTLMNWLESYRQSRKMGWSRAWNKYGLTTFQSFKLQPEEDRQIINQGFQWLEHVEHIPSQAQQFIHELQHAENIMAFLFFSEYCEDEQYYESITLSLGRKVKDQPRFRDRLDIIFDAPIRNNQVQNLGRVRLYIDPFQTTQKEPLWQQNFDVTLPEGSAETFAQLCQLSWDWQDNTAKHWDHWTSHYIDYFGPRNLDLAESFLWHPSAQRMRTEQLCSMS